jgi:hypothetical protein
MDHLVGTTRNGVLVYVNLIRSEAAKHISRQPYLLGLADKALQKTTLKNEDVTVEVDMGKAIGYNFIVPTTDASRVFYAKISREDITTRFVRGGEPLSTKYLTLSLKRRANDGGYDLLGIWVGKTGPPRPGSPNETAESRPFWAQHAYILDKQPLQSHTITKVCPY